MSRHTSRTAHALLAQLIAVLGPNAQLLHAHEREWASITFSGARHHFVLEIPEQAATDPGFLRALAGLPEYDFALSGEIVADCTATIGMPMHGGRDASVRLVVIELLTVVAD